MSHILAVDIGSSKIAAALVDEEGQLSHRRQCPTLAVEGAEAILGRVTRLAGEVMAAETDGVQPVAVGVGTGGQVDPRDGHIIYATPLLPGWTGLSLRARLEAALGLPVAVDNDVNVAGLGEAAYGAGRWQLPVRRLGALSRQRALRLYAARPATKRGPGQPLSAGVCAVGGIM